MNQSQPRQWISVRLRAAAVALLLLACAPMAFAQSVSITAFNVPATQDFDTLASTGTSSTLPNGWYLVETGTNANTTYAAGTGSDTAGNTYSFGAASASERAFGGQLSSSLVPTIGGAFTNNTGATITQLSVSYVGEQWRFGAVRSPVVSDRLDFQYSLDATALNTGAWTDVDALDFTSPINTGTVGALNGNLPANQAALTATISGLSIANGATFWIRWNDFNVTSSDDGLAVDNFSITAVSTGPTNPSVSGAANPSTVVATGTTLLTATVTPGTNPASTGLAVTGDLTSIGGSATQTFYDDATNGDVTAADNIFSYSATVDGATPAGAKSLALTVTDAELRTGSGTISLTVISTLPPSVTASANPASLPTGNTTLLTAAVTSGANPPSLTYTVTGDLTAIGGSATQSFFDDGTNGDVTADDDVFSYLATVDATNGTKSIQVNVVDDQARTASTTVSIEVIDPSMPIHEVQGNGNTSPHLAEIVTTEGIVTGRRSNGFFIQLPVAEYDSDPLTSEGVFVFTSSAPPPAAQAGNRVAVKGTVAEFKGATGSNPGNLTLTELTFATVYFISSGHPLPPTVTLTAADAPANGTLDQLERYEGMRVQGSFKATAGTEGTTNEANGTNSSFGDFHVVFAGVARPMREPGISNTETIPNPPCCIPVFDENPEMLRVNSDAIDVAFKTEVPAGTLPNMVGILDYSYGATSSLARYTIDPTEAPVVLGDPIVATPVDVPLPTSVTVGSYNLERLYDTVNDAGVSDVQVSAAYLATRLKKMSLSIRNVMRSPDIIGVVEVENIGVLGQLATQINNDAIAASQPNPNYSAILLEGNDVGGIDVGYLVGGRVTVIGTPEQISKDLTWVDPNDGLTKKLHDRPSLVIKATVNNGTLPAIPVTVVVNHLKAMPANNDRDRLKRRLQAEDIAAWLQARQTADPTERIIMVGDFNAYDVNDGYADTVGTIIGEPTPATEVVSPSPDLVDPNLVLLTEDVAADQRYSFEFDGHAQAIDHGIVTANLAGQATMQFGRNNADFPETLRVDPLRSERASDHDMLVVTINPMAHFTISTPASVESGTQFAFTVTARDGQGAVATGYTGTIEFISSDNTAALPADYTFTAGDNGVKTFNMTLNEMGIQRIRVRDTLDNLILGETTTNVLCGVVVPTATSTSPACIGGSVSLDVDLVGESYAWTGPNGFTASVKNPTRTGLTASDAGQYDVVVTLSSGCSYAASTTVQLQDALTTPVITADADTVCGSSTGHTASVVAQAGAAYSWTVTNGTITSGQGTNAITWTAAASGPASIGASLTNSCGTVNASKSVTILPIPVVVLVAPTSVAVNSTENVATTDAQDGVTYTWTLTGGTITAGQGTNSITFSAGNPGSTMTLSVVVASTGSCGQAASSKQISVDFLDVAINSVFREMINEIARLGITTGCGGGNYCPSLVVPREQMAGFLSRGVAGGDANVPSAGTVNGVAYNCAVGGNSLFTDVPETAYFCRHIHYIANLGITTGCTVAGDIFCPLTNTNRAQMAAFIGRTLAGSDAAIPTAVTLTGGINEWGLPRAYDCGDDAANYFPDVPDSEFFCRQIYYIWARGIVDGYPNGSYGPTDIVLREQMAKFLANAF